jgi:hypothetical protein
MGRLVKGSYFSESSSDGKPFFVRKKNFLIVVIRLSAFHLQQGKRTNTFLARRNRIGALA